MDGGWYSNNFHIYIGLAILRRLKIRFSIFLWVFRKMNIFLGGGGGGWGWGHEEIVDIFDGHYNAELLGGHLNTI